MLSFGMFKKLKENVAGASIDKNKSTEEQQLRLIFRNLQQFVKREGRGKTRPVQQVVVSAEMAVDEA